MVACCLSVWLNLSISWAVSNGPGGSWFFLHYKERLLDDPWEDELSLETNCSLPPPVWFRRQLWSWDTLENQRVMGRSIFSYRNGERMEYWVGSTPCKSKTGWDQPPSPGLSHPGSLRFCNRVPTCTTSKRHGCLIIGYCLKPTLTHFCAGQITKAAGIPSLTLSFTILVRDSVPSVLPELETERLWNSPKFWEQPMR